MWRALKFVAWIAAALIAVPLLLAGAVLIGANTAPGRRVIESLAQRFSQGTVSVAGLSGRFPDDIRVQRVTVADSGGAWLTVDDAAVVWSPWRLVEGKVAIGRLEARSVAVSRLPVATSGGSSGGGFPVPRGMVSHLRVARLEFGPAVAGRVIVLAVEGAAEITGGETGEAHLAVTAPPPSTGATPDHYLAEMSMAPSHLRATLTVAESAHGLIAGLAQLPDLGAINIAVAVDGPLNALDTKATVEAGRLRATATGGMDAVVRGVDLSFAVLAPAMTPGPGIGWSSIRLEGNVQGPIASPKATAVLSAADLTAAGAGVALLRANVTGTATGETELHANLSGLHLPGPSPEVLGGGPLTLDASIRLAEANHPARFTISHPLFSAEGFGDSGRVQMHLTLPDLAPFAAIGGADVHGHSALNLGAVQSANGIDFTVTGGAGIADAMSPVPALVGDSGTIDLAGSVRGGEGVTLSRLTLHGAAFSATASGRFLGDALNLDWSVSLNDLGAIQPSLSGSVEARGHAGGRPESLAIAVDVTGDVGATGQRLEQIVAHLDAAGPPKAARGRLTAGGRILGAPLDVAISAERRNGGFHLDIDRAQWKSLTGGGTLDLAQGETLPTGKVTLSMTRLADLAPLLGQPVAGAVEASLVSAPGAATIGAVVTGAALPATGGIAKAVLDAKVTDPGGHANVAGVLTLDGVAAGGVLASARLAASGPLDGLDLTLTANAADLRGKPGRLETSARLSAEAETLSLTSLRGTWGPETVRLLAPARVGFAKGVAVDKLRLGFRQGELSLGGRWNGSAGGGLDATLSNLPVDIIAAVEPSFAADGTISGDAKLSGTTARPEGSIRVSASGLRLRTGPGRAMPAAAATVNATLDGTSARVDAKMTAGKSSVTATGRVPAGMSGGMDLRVGGAVDLAMLNPLVAAQGRNVRGLLDLRLDVTGTPAVPKAGGTVALSNGDLQDASLGVHVSGIAATAQAAGDTVRLDRFEGKAGQGTISGGGTVTIGAAPVVDLVLRASNARILSSDLVTALIDANLTLRGALNANPVLAGTILARTAEIRVPEKLPASIAVLPVREAGAPVAKPPPPAPPPPDIALNLALDAPSEIYVRGRGVDAELGGRVTFAGTAANPVPQGRLNLRRGSFSLAGTSLNLTEGTIDFAGGPLTNPQLKLVATSGTAAFTSTLTISGDVRNPKIVLSSIPDMPQDEILSQLLFNTVRARLNPFQVAQIAAALASISGVGPSIGDPLGGVRSALGLDQLSVGSDPRGGTSLQAGRYLARGVRLGASQSATGTGTQATVQIDIAKGLKLETTAGTGSATATPGAPGVSSGSGVGVTYQFEY